MKKPALQTVHVEFEVAPVAALAVPAGQLNMPVTSDTLAIATLLLPGQYDPAGHGDATLELEA